MKKFHMSVILAGVLALTAACYNEDALKPVSELIPIRYDFPEGANSWDDDAMAIAEEFNVFLIYKSIEEYELNRSWTGSGSATYPVRSYPLNDEQAKFYMDFMKYHIFAHLNTKILPKVLPTYIFLAYDMRQETSWSSYGLGDACWPRKFDGMDYWAFCLEGETPGPNGDLGSPYEQIYRPQTPDDFWKRRAMILYEIINKAVDNGNIVAPEGFAARFDFATPFKYGAANVDDPNFCRTRGFPGRWGGSDVPIIYDVTAMSEIGPTRTFKDYLDIAICYPEAEFKTIYAAYPNIIQNYKDIVAHFKVTYDWDIAAIAERR